MDEQEDFSVGRGTSITSKMENMISRVIGSGYLKKILTNTLLHVINGDYNFELDPEKLTGNNEKEKKKRIEKNLNNLIDICQKLLAEFTNEESILLIPKPIQKIAQINQFLAMLKNPKSSIAIVGGYLILRLINPAIITPIEYKIVPKSTKISPQAQKNLKIITLILQKLVIFLIQFILF